MNRYISEETEAFNAVIRKWGNLDKGTKVTLVGVRTDNQYNSGCVALIHAEGTIYEVDANVLVHKNPCL